MWVRKNSFEYKHYSISNTINHSNYKSIFDHAKKYRVHPKKIQYNLLIYYNGPYFSDKCLLFQVFMIINKPIK
jgi:hypothetical protein